MFRRILKWCQVVFVPIQDIDWKWRYYIILLLYFSLEDAYYRLRWYLFPIFYNLAGELLHLSWQMFLFRSVADYLSYIGRPSQLFVEVKDYELRRIERYRAMNRQAPFTSLPIKLTLGN